MRARVALAARAELAEDDCIRGTAHCQHVLILQAGAVSTSALLPPPAQGFGGKTTVSLLLDVDGETAVRTLRQEGVTLRVAALLPGGERRIQAMRDVALADLSTGIRLDLVPVGVILLERVQTRLPGPNREPHTLASSKLVHDELFAAHIDSSTAPLLPEHCEMRGQHPSHARLRACSCCRRRAYGLVDDENTSPDGKTHTRSSPAPRRKPKTVAFYDQNSYNQLRTAEDNLRPTPKPASARSRASPESNGNAYLHIQTKIAGLLKMCRVENASDRGGLNPPVLDGDDDNIMLSTVDLLTRSRAAKNTSTSPWRPAQEPRLRSSGADMPMLRGEISLSPSVSWSMHAAELTGRSHRSMFLDSMGAIYGRLYRQCLAE
eukprot:m.106114 g.106114  ORF g.106114 m.106114 type:complete len:377 (+) comp9168_c0_seq1:1615-2745(+)